MDELEGLLHDSDSHLLLSTVSSLHHEGVEESLNDGAVHLLEASLLVATSGEGKVNVSLDSLDVQVSHQGDVLGLDTLESPSSE